MHRSKNSALIILTALLIIMCTPVLAQADDQNAAPLPVSCTNIQYLMGQSRAAIDNINSDPVGGLRYSGGSLPERTNFTLPAQTLGQVWLLNVRNQAERVNQLMLTFNSTSAPIEVALFNGAQPLRSDGEVYNVITPSQERTLTYQTPSSGLYSLLIRRLDYSTTPDTAIIYQLNAQYSAALVSPDVQSVLATGLRVDDLQVRTADQAQQAQQIRTQAGALSQAPIVQTNVTTLAFNGGGRLDFRPWVRSASAFGGDVILLGEADGRRRILYVEDVDLMSVSGNEFSEVLTDDNGTELRTDWQAVDGLWLLRDCAGVLLRDGRSFLAELPDNAARQFSATGDLSDFVVVSSGARLQLDWRVTQAPANPDYDADAQLQRLNARYDLPLACARHLMIETNWLRASRWDVPPPQDASCDGNPAVPISVEMSETDTQRLQIDWSNLYSLTTENNAESGNRLRFTLRDESDLAVSRDGITTERLLPRLRTFTARAGVIDIVTDPISADVQVSVRGIPQAVTARHVRLLPVDESYIELEMRAGTPQYIAAALPDERGYAPRALNNMGRECYSVNTLLDELNCAPNGEVNAANGNLWYAVTDLLAQGAGIDLALTRSYNSRAATVDGPFGKGWQSGLRFDYATAAYDEAAAARQVDLITDDMDYPVMLDLSWQPGGYITFTTPSGSQHLFIEEGDSGFYRGQTMPRWHLSEPTDALPRYLLWQPSGLTYEFDRAGRLRCYGFPDPTTATDSADAYPYESCADDDDHSGRWIVLDYAWQTALNGPGALPADRPALTLTDAASLRQLDLYFNSDHHVVRSVLRAANSDGENCSLAADCLQTRYSYDNDALTGVTYADGQQATYAYSTNIADAGQRLCYHADVRAPQLRSAIYGYIGADSGVDAVYIAQDDAPTCDAEGATLWRRFNAESISTAFGETLRITRTDETGFSRTYDYTQEQAETLDVLDNNFTLFSHNSDIPGAFNINSYQWRDGLLVGLGQPRVGAQSVWNTTELDYTAGELSGIGFSGILNNGALPGFSLLDLPLPDSSETLRTIGLSDQTNLQIRSAVGGRTLEWIDRAGAAHSYTWQDGHISALRSQISADAARLLRYERDASGLVTAVSVSVPGGTAYTLRYTYDYLGRVIAVEDDLIGRYSLRYLSESTTCAGNPCETAIVIISDPLGAVTTRRYDAQGRLTEERMEQGAELLRCTTYDYHDDAQHRGALQAVTRWNDTAGVITADCRSLSQARTTTYDYAPLIEDGRQHGERLTIAHALGRTEIIDTDNNGRVMRRADNFGNEVRYSYQAGDYIDVQQLAQGRRVQMRVEERHIVAGGLDQCVYTYFDRTRRPVLLEVRYGNGAAPTSSAAPCDELTVDEPMRWLLIYRETTYPLTDAGLRQIRTEYLFQIQEVSRDVVRTTRYAVPGTNDAQATLSQLTNAFSGEAETRSYSVTESYNVAGTLETLQTGQTGAVANTVRVCPMERGQTRVVRFLEGTAPDAIPDCATIAESSEQVTSVTWYDSYERPLCHADAGGATHRYRYSIVAGNWQIVDDSFAAALCVDVLAAGATITPQFSETYTYNPAGDLLQAQTADGTRYFYTVDDYGQVLSVTLDDPANNPQVTYQYNVAGQLLEEEASDGAGFAYRYTAAGQLALAQNLQTQDTITYIYDTAGRLTDRIGSQGERTTYQRSVTLEDGLRRDNITVTDPLGGVHRYLFDPDALTLTYEDPLDNRTRYQFDTLGALWRIDDAAGRAHLLRYDARGRFVNWQQSRTDEDAAQDLIVDYAALREGLAVSLSESHIPAWSQTYSIAHDGALTRVQHGQSAALNIGYDSAGRLANISAGEREWTITHDPQMRQLVLRVGDERDATLAYDAFYRLERYQQAAADTLRWTYRLDRTEIQRATGETVVLRQPPQSSTLPQQLIVEGNVNNPAQRRVYTFGPDGQVTDVEDVICLPDAFSDPDAACSIASASDAQLWQSAIEVAYNDVGLPISIINRDQSVESFSYDRAGNLETYQTANRGTFRYGYDALNRLNRLTAPGDILIFLQYNALDEVVGICQAQEGTNAPQNYAECRTRGVELESYRTDALGRLNYRLFNTAENGRLSPQGFAYTYGVEDDNGLLQTWGALDGALPDANSTRPALSTDRVAAVELAYAADGLTLASALIETGLDARYDFSYDVRGALRGISGELEYRYGYDALGALSSLSINDALFRYSSNADAGHTLQLPDGREIIYDRNHSGLFAGLRLRAADETQSLLRLTYQAEGDELVVLLPDLQRSALRLDARGALSNFLFLANRFQVSIARDALGIVQRQNVSGSSEFFVADAPTSLLSTFNRDETRRPLTVRVNDGNGGVLYTVIDTYNTGALNTEIRQFADGTQQTVTHNYSAFDAESGSNRRIPQRVSSTIALSTTSTATARSTATLLLGIFSMGLVGSFRRRRLLIALVAMAGVLALLGVWATTAQTSIITYDYDYDVRGSLQRLTITDAEGETCTTTYSYDEAGRLIGQSVRPNLDLSVRRTYEYDAYNRLTRIEGADDSLNLLYAGAAETPFAAQRADGTLTYFAQTEGRALGFVITAQGAQQILYDGDGNILTTVDGQTASTPLWLVDPRSRHIPLDRPADPNGDVCTFGLPDERLSAVGDLTLIFNDGAVWDAVGDLYFVAGRAYNPDIERFLQRDPLGPDVVGDLYAFPSRQNLPPVRPWRAPYLNGLTQLSDALAAQDISAELRADAVLQRALPPAYGVADAPLGDLLAGVNGAVEAELRAVADFPTTLQQDIAANIIRIDPLTGAVRLPDITRPGHNSWATPLPTADPRRFHDAAPAAQAMQPPNYVNTMLAYRAVTRTPFTTYVPEQWRPTSQARIAAFALPQAPVTQTPTQLRDALYQPLRHANNGAASLALLRDVQTNLNRPLSDWLKTLLDASLPATPQLPPNSPEGLRANWFTQDAFRLAQRLAAAWPVPDAPRAPAYAVGIPEDALALPAPPAPLVD